MDRERLSGRCLLALLITALILCSRPRGAEGQGARESNCGSSEKTSVVTNWFWGITLAQGCLTAKIEGLV